MKLIKNIIFTTLALLFISCGNNTDEPIKDITAIKIEESNRTIYSTDDSHLSTDFTAKAYYSDGTSAIVTKKVKWYSSDIDVASVVYGAVLGGKSNGGDANITISYKNLNGSTFSTLHVVSLVDYNISLIDADANVTGTYDLLAIGSFEDNTTRTIVKNIEWVVDNGAIISGEGNETQAQVLAGDTNITSILFSDVNMSRTIIYRVE